MNLEKPTACILDLDGTVVRHKNKQLIAQLERLDTLIHILTKPFRGYKTLPTEMDLTMAVESNPVIHRVMHAFRTMRGIDVDQIVEPENGVEDFFKLLKQQNLPIGLSSNAYGRNYGKQVLRYYNLRQYFDALLFRENVRHGKPYAEPVLRAVHALGLDENKEEVIWFLGDQAKDMKAVMEAQKKLPKKWTLVPLAFNSPHSTAYIYLERRKRRKKIKDIGNQNYIRSFNHLRKKLEKIIAS